MHIYIIKNRQQLNNKLIIKTTTHKKALTTFLNVSTFITDFNNKKKKRRIKKCQNTIRSKVISSVYNAERFSNSNSF